MTFGEKLRMMREEASLTQEELASRIDISRQMVQKYEAGESKPARDKIDRFANALSVDKAAAVDLFNLPKVQKLKVSANPSHLETLKENFNLNTEVMKKEQELGELRQKLNSFERLLYERYVYEMNTEELTEWMVQFVEDEVRTELPDYEFIYREALESALYQQVATQRYPSNIKALVSQHPKPLDPEAFDSYATGRMERRVRALFDALDDDLSLEQALENGWAISVIEPIAHKASRDPASAEFLRHMCEPNTEVTPRTGPAIASQIRATKETADFIEAKTGRGKKQSKKVSKDLTERTKKFVEGE